MKAQDFHKMLGLDFKLPRIPASLAAAQMYSREMEQVLASVKSTNEIKRIQEILNPRLLGLSTGLKSLELNSEYSRHLKSIHDDNFRIGKELIEQFSNPFGAHTAKIAELQESLMRGTSAKTYRELREILNPSIFAISEAQQTLRDQFTRLSQLDLNSVDFAPEDENTAQELIEEFESKSSERTSISITINQMFVVVEKEPNPAVQLIILSFFQRMLEAILWSTIFLYITPHLPASIGQTSTEAKKNSKEIATQFSEISFALNQFRYTSAKSLALKTHPKSRSQEIGLIPFGSRVRILDTERDFSLIEWTNPRTQTDVQGWVFSRYLEKFK